MNCKKCGAMIEIGKSFCGNCGAPVSEMYGAMGSQGQDVQGKNAPGSGAGSVICGILALVFDCLTCAFLPIGMIGLVLGIFGIIYGRKEYRENGTKAARTGKEVSIVALVILACCVYINSIIWG